MAGSQLGCAFGLLLVLMLNDRAESISPVFVQRDMPGGPRISVRITGNETGALPPAPQVFSIRPAFQVRWTEVVKPESRMVQDLVLWARRRGWAFAQTSKRHAVDSAVASAVAALVDRGSFDFDQPPFDLDLLRCESVPVGDPCVVDNTPYSFELCNSAGSCQPLGDGQVGLGSRSRVGAPPPAGEPLPPGERQAEFDIELEPGHPVDCKVAFFQLFVRDQEPNLFDLEQLENSRSDPSFSYSNFTFYRPALHDKNLSLPLASCKFGTCPGSVGARVACMNTPSEAPPSAQAGANSVLLSIFGPFLAVLFIIGVVGVCRAARRRRNHVVLEVAPRWQIRHSQLDIGRLLDKGEFGAVFLATLSGVRSEEFQVAVKASGTELSDEKASKTQLEEFYNEACVLQIVCATPHENIVSLFGMCASVEPLLLALELCEHGNLRDFLLHASLNLLPDFQHVRFDADRLRRMALGAASGLAHIQQMGVVHRDLAARNCLVGAGLTVKLSDFGMSRNIRLTGEIVQVNVGRLPVRWMSPESLVSGLFNYKTDVWSFGVLLWEIFTFGATPYTTLRNDEVVHSVVAGHRLLAPVRCPPHIKALLDRCWGSLNRPSIHEIVRVLSEQDSDVHIELSADIADTSFNSPEVWPPATAPGSPPRPASRVHTPAARDSAYATFKNGRLV